MSISQPTFQVLQPPSSEGPQYEAIVDRALYESGNSLEVVRREREFLLAALADTNVKTFTLLVE